jgi:hypothetical protein
MLAFDVQCERYRKRLMGAKPVFQLTAGLGEASKFIECSIFNQPSHLELKFISLYDIASLV